VTAHTVVVRSVAGEVSGTVVLDQTVFGIQPNVPVLHQVVTAQLAAARRGTHSTKTRAEVRGGGKKPFKQKGTGRARQGSIRAPHWAGGGVALGPKPRSYRQRTPRKMIQLALHSALSDRADAQRVVVVDEWPWTEARTRVAKELLGILGLDGSVLVVLDRSRDEHAFLSFRNLAEAQVILSGELNAYDVLCNDWVLFTRATLPGVTTEGPAPAEEEPPAAAPIDEAPVPGDQADATDETGGEEPLEEPDDDDADEATVDGATADHERTEEA
jgi:large subunit ribosomal protein L4